MKALPYIYLASRSKRRQDLLDQIGVHYELLNSFDIDETPVPNEIPAHYVERLAIAKSQAGVQSPGYKKPWPVLGADTIVVFQNRLLGKPKNKEDYTETLLSLSNNTHEVYTGICLSDANQSHSRVVVTEVTMGTIAPEECDYYWEQYHPGDKAGGYGIQEFASVFVEKINGNYSNVVGLPLRETYLLLQSF